MSKFKGFSDGKALRVPEWPAFEHWKEIPKLGTSAEALLYEIVQHIQEVEIQLAKLKANG